MADALSISELYKELKFHVETSFSSMKIYGELGSFVKSQVGHYYFSLKDEESLINCALFRFDAQGNKDLISIKEGDQVLITGKVTLYNKRSNVQIIVKSIKALNKQGLLKEKFEKLKIKLSKEGLFDVSRKKRIPANPKRVAVISSVNAAGLTDFLTIMKRNCFFYDLLVVPCLVQGEKAPASIKSALKKVEALDDIDVVLLTRGGGSLEDLWCYNDESLVRMISEYEIPIITAIGHERDNSLADFSSDLRLETPSAAAEYLSQNQSELLNVFESSKRSLSRLKETLFNTYQMKLEKCSPKKSLQYILGKHNYYMKKLRKNSPQNFLEKIDYYGLVMRLEDCRNKFDSQIQNLQMTLRGKLNRIESVLNTTNPKNVLKRGFSYISVDDKVIGSLKDFKKNEREKVIINFHDGKKELKG